MKTFVPSPQFLPVTLNIHIPSKSVKLQNITISNTDTAADVKNIIRQKMEKLGDPVIEFEKANVFMLVNGPPELAGTENKMIDEDVPVVSYHPEPGSSLILQGHLRCKSEAPKQCFKSIYEKDSNTAMDYFSCKDCKLNWLCKSCTEVCHKGHKVIDYIQNHKPTWACCYCVKSGQCTLFKRK